MQKTFCRIPVTTSAELCSQISLYGILHSQNTYVAQYHCLRLTSFFSDCSFSHLIIQPAFLWSNVHLLNDHCLPSAKHGNMPWHYRINKRKSLSSRTHLVDISFSDHLICFWRSLPRPSSPMPTRGSSCLLLLMVSLAFSSDILYLSQTQDGQHQMLICHQTGRDLIINLETPKSPINFPLSPHRWTTGWQVFTAPSPKKFPEMPSSLYSF